MIVMMMIADDTQTDDARMLQDDINRLYEWSEK